MFLTVPATMCGMDELTQEQRDDLAARIAEKERTQYDGLANRAYTDAKVNSGTWTRAKSGQKLRADRLIAIVRTLWPETDGDWTRMDPPLGGAQGDLMAEIERSDLAPRTKARIRELLSKAGEDPPPKKKRGAS